VTQVKWLTHEPELFVETSEDLYMRLWDCRVKPFKPVVEFKLDTNFATTCDIWEDGASDLHVVTGHRGFNSQGCDVKLWDLHKMVSKDYEEP
jgi:hypothetical protein